MQGSHDFYNNDLDFNNSIFETFLSYYNVNLLYYLINNNKRFILLFKKHSILRIERASRTSHLVFVSTNLTGHMTCII